jgi:hypothetical protein
MQEFYIGYETTKLYKIVMQGLSFGTPLAIVISYHKNRSVLWAIIQGFFTWFYVFYFLLTRENE